ncbi:WD repeat-containing protein 91-like [Ctenocephalides felis]|uniref:WD repeat-containing protein 91-like n=1 Tax=Ctenocephalides felis TaxID=7515 RepID=UPI000E6E3CFD|nr:WD repeat-containing protein 91-like [Ctenocephalides felis]
MSHIQYVDELVREYLLFRGFSNTLKSYDNELKHDKDRGFRVDKLIDQIISYIHNYDLQGLRDLWGHLDSLLFSKLEQHFTPAIRKLEFSLLKYYLVTAVTNNKIDKVTEFFTKLASELQSQTEWKDWFVLPYIKSPEDNPTFSVYFTKQWQDTLLVSLHNLLATVFQCMPQPTLSSIDAEASLIKRLQEENNHLRNRLASMQPITNLHDIVPIEVPPPTHLVDDFYIIAQDSSQSLTEYASHQARSLKSLIKNIGSGGSPVMGRKDTSSDRNKKRSGSVGSSRLSSNY